MAPHDPFEQHLQRAAELFEAGDIVQAGQIWQAILKRNPAHETARAGLYRVKLYFDSRATQGGLADAPVPAAAQENPGDPALLRMLDHGCSLYDAGCIDEAIHVWEQVLEKDPGNALARGYANRAREALGRPLLPEPDAASGAGSEAAPEADLPPLPQPPPAPEAPLDSPRATVAAPAELMRSLGLGTAGAAEAPQAPAAIELPPAEPQRPIPAGFASAPAPRGAEARHPSAQDAMEALDALIQLHPAPGPAAPRPAAPEPAAPEPAAPGPAAPEPEPLATQALLPGEATPAMASAPLEPAALEPAAPEPAAPVPPPVDVEALLRDGCTLFDMGQPEDALRKWERILEVAPDHILAREYIQGARKDLGLPPLAEGEVPHAAPDTPPDGSPAVSPAAPPLMQVVPGGMVVEDERVERILRNAVQLWDMGMVVEAVEKWEQVLTLRPGHREAEEYLALARKDLAAVPPKAAPAPPPPLPVASPAPKAAPAPAPEGTPRPQPPPPRAQAAPPPVQMAALLEPRFREAEHCLAAQDFDAAAQAFQAILATEPQNARALQGYQQARSLAAAQTRGPVTAQPQATSPEEVQPPATLTEPTPGHARRGMDLPEALRRASLPPWLQSPKVLGMLLLGFVLLAVTVAVILHLRAESAFKATVKHEREAAMAKVARATQVLNLSEEVEALRKEADQALRREDALTAYLRAQELLRLSPGDGLGAQILERSRAMLAASQPQGSPEEAAKLMADQNLEDAQKMLASLLKQSPDDAGLRTTAARLCLAMAQRYAATERMDEAQEQLKRGRSLQPQDKSWQARLVLLEHLQTLPRADRAPWIQLLD